MNAPFPPFFRHLPRCFICFVVRCTCFPSFPVETNHGNTDRLLDPRLDVAAQQFLTGQELTADNSYRKGNVTNSTISSSLPSGDSVCPTVEPKSHASVPWSQRRDMIHSIPTAPQYQRQQHHFVQPLDDDDKYKRRVALGGLARFFR